MNLLRRFNKYGFSTLGILLFFGFSTTTSFAKPMTAEQLSNEYIGKSLSFKAPGGSSGKVRFRKNGTVKLWNTNFSVKEDSGTWRFKGNQLCNSWKKIRDGKERCFSITKVGDRRYKDNQGTEIRW